MPKKRFGAEQIVTLLRQIEVSMAQDKSTPVGCRDAGDIAAEFRDELLNGRSLLQLERSTDRRPAMAKALQHSQTAFITWISTTGAADDKPVPATARSDRTNAIISSSR